MLDLLTQLVDKSLVVVDEQQDGTARYRLLETLRQYGRARSAARGESAWARSRHAAHYLAMAEAGSALGGHDKTAWQARLEVDHDNLRAALWWLLEQADAARCLSVAEALAWDWWVLRGHLSEGREWMTAVLASPAAAPSTAVRGMAAALRGRGRPAAG